ncbi:MAG: hypothetical protein JST39_19825, partial [Bacteroidetes bacterium]|nr:hypothetical protein [Bacteroidota bacterium]
AYCHKIENKFRTALGPLVPIKGLSSEALSPHVKSVIVMDGCDIGAVLDGDIDLDELLYKKRRKAVETGNVYVNYSQLKDG